MRLTTSPQTAAASGTSCKEAAGALGARPLPTMPFAPASTPASAATSSASSVVALDCVGKTADGCGNGRQGNGRGRACKLQHTLTVSERR